MIFFRSLSRQELIDGLGEARGLLTEVDLVKESSWKEGSLRFEEYSFLGLKEERVKVVVGFPKEQLYSVPVMALHQTNEDGYKEVFAQAKTADPELAYGRELLERGHIVFSMDFFLTGERSPVYKWQMEPFYEEYPRWSVLGRMVEETKKCVDVMLKQVLKADQLHMIGHSLGGVVALLYSGIYSEVKRVVANAAYFRPQLPWRKRKAQLYHTRLLNQDVDKYQLGNSFDSLLVLSAENSELLVNCYSDDVILWDPVPGCFQKIRIWKQHTRIVVNVFPGGHVFTPERRVQAYEFIEKQ